MAQSLNSSIKIWIMKKIGFILSAILLITNGLVANSQDTHGKEPNSFNYKEIKHNAFTPGEVLNYKLAYGIINAGTAELTVNKSDLKIQGRELWHMVGTGRSISAFDWFFKVRDRYETFMDANGMFPWLFVRRISEGGYDKAQDYKFFQHEGRVVNEDKEEYKVPYGVQDMLSSFYYARTLDFKDAKKGDIFQFPAFVDEEVYPIRMKFMGKKIIKIKAGKYKCLEFSPAVQEGRIFKSDEDLTVYITDDENKIPVLARAKILVGSIRMELTGYEGLANPVAKLD